MATFKYKAVSRDGAPVNGVIEAYDELEAIEHIKESCTIVTAISEVRRRPREAKDLFAPSHVSYKALSLLCSQFSIILTAGLPVVRTVELIRDQTSDHMLRSLLGKVSEDVSAGYGLAASFENKGGRILPTTFIETVRSGEESGTLEASFRKLHLYYERSAGIRSAVRSAMMYPLFLCVLAAAVIAVIMVFTMPTFTRLFVSMDIEMPPMTLALISISEFFAKYWWLMALLLIMIVIIIKTYSVSENGSINTSRLQLRIPILGTVAKMKAASQTANTISTLLTAGLPMIRTVSITSKVLDNRYIGYRLGTVIPGLEEGRRLGDGLREMGCYPDMLCEMAAVGEETGSLEETFTTIGSYYDNEVEIATKRALGLLQPAITVVMGIVIGIIVISLYMPMFSMYSGM